MIDQSYLAELALEYGRALEKTDLEKFDLYAELLVEWNQKINLTAITNPNEIVVKHFIDSLLLLDAVSVKQNASIIDVGTGAGFPSVPCKIVRDDLKLTLLDSLNKRIHFLQTLSERLGIQINCVHSRAEDAGKNMIYREQYDYTTARAVARLRELSEYCLPFVKVGGCFVALKGYEIEEELEEAKPAIKQLGGQIQEVRKYRLPMENKRAIVIIEKISQTPTRFPRISAKIKKQPLR